jgi:cytochrome c oxidase subunit 1
MDGMQRRVPDYNDAFAHWNHVASSGFLLVLAGLVCFFINIFWSLIAGKKAADNPWGEGARTLEWTLPSPPPYHQFSTLPRID